MTKAKVKVSKSHSQRSAHKSKGSVSHSSRTNPKRSGTPTKKTTRTPRPRSFYNASDDARIL